MKEEVVTKVAEHNDLIAGSTRAGSRKRNLMVKKTAGCYHVVLIFPTFLAKLYCLLPQSNYDQAQELLSYLNA